MTAGVQLRVFNFLTPHSIMFIHTILPLNHDYLNFDLFIQAVQLLDFVLQMNDIINLNNSMLS